MPTITVKDSAGVTQTINTQPNLGATTAAGSVPVAIATDQLSTLAVASKQDAGNASIASIDSKTPALSGGKVPVTDPTSLPLPSGAATAALQTLGNDYLSVISQGGANLVGYKLDAWTVGANTVRTNDYGVGPIPGTRSVRIVTSVPSQYTILKSTEVTMKGRGDGARFIGTVYLKGTPGQQVQFYAYSRTESPAAATDFNTVETITLTADWARYQVYHSFLPSTIKAVGLGFNAVSGAVDFEASCVDLRLSYDGASQPYAEPVRPPTQATSGVAVPMAQTTSVCCWGDSLTSGSADGSNFRAELARLLNGASIYNGGVSGETSTQVKDRAVLATGLAGWYNSHLGCVTIWVGRNNTNAPDTIVADVASIVATLPHGRFLVLSVTNNTAEPVGSSGYNNIANANAKLASVYGSRFVDVRSALTAGTLTDIPNTTYMYDASHPTWSGYGIVAMEIYKAMILNGYIPWVTLPVANTQIARSYQAKFTRPADTTAYAIGDAVANSTTLGSVAPLTIPLTQNKPIKRLGLIKLGTTLTNAQFRLHVFGAPPTPAAADNAPISLTGAANYLGRFSITMDQSFTDGAAGFVDVGAGLTGHLPSSGSLYILIEALAAYAPVSSETFTVIAES